MKKSKRNRKGQSSLEYLIVVGIGLFIVGAAVSYVVYYSGGYSTQSSAQQLQIAAESVQNALQSLSSSEAGSSVSFSFISPGLGLTSSMCSSFLSFVNSKGEASMSLPISVSGELPLSAGTYKAVAYLGLSSGAPVASLHFDLPLSYINYSYTMNSGNLYYSVSFYNQTNGLVDDVNFTVLVYTSTHKLVASQNETTTSGQFTGNLALPYFTPGDVVVVYVPSQGVMSPSCMEPSNTIIPPAGLQSYVPLTITNSQPYPTPSPFQQLVNISSQNYRGFESNNLDNTEFFYPNGTIIPSWLQGGNTAFFNGNNSGTPGGPESYINGTSQSSFPISAFAWIYPESYGSSNFEVIFEYGGSYSSAGQFELGLHTNGDLVLWNGSTNLVSSFVPPLNSWSLVGFSASSTAVNFYFNGQVQTIPSNNVLTNSGGNWIIGWQAPDGGRDFYGSIADVQLYSSVIPASAAATLYSNGLGSSPVQTSGLIGWWPLAGNAKDYSGNNNNGVATNVIYNGVGPTSTSTTYWLKLGSIPADSTEQVFMNFAPKSNNLFNTVNTGEAPQLSSTYAEYDDGLSVFLNYTNFYNVDQTLFNYDPPFFMSTDSGLHIYINTTSNGQGISSPSLWYGSNTTELITYEDSVSGTIPVNLLFRNSNTGEESSLPYNTLRGVPFYYYNVNSIPKSDGLDYVLFYINNNFNGAATLPWLAILNNAPNSVMPSAFSVS